MKGIVSLYCIVSFIVGRRHHPSAFPVHLHPCPSPRDFFFRIILVAAVLTFAGTPVLHAQDTTRHLEAVVVSGQRTPSTILTPVPTQVADAAKLEEQGALQLSDALKMMAGVTMKDYGGIGGIKTVSARGLGSQFSTLTIDGIAVNDAQNGQVDLGRYLVGNAAYVSLSQGQQQSDLLSARAYAAGSVINLESREPSFFMAERTNMRVGMEAGSFGMLSPSLLWERKWNRRLSSSVWVNWLKSDGDYPFTLFYTTSRTDSTSRERRQHSAMHMLTADGNLFWHLDNGDRLSAKVHYMQGYHQLPGPVIYYNQMPSAESTSEQLAFSQLRWQHIRNQWKVQSLAKLQYTNDLWEDSAAVTSTGYAFNRYRQYEAYLSTSASYNINKSLSARVALDGDAGHLLSNLSQRNDVTRLSLMAVAALNYRHKGLTLDANLLYTHIADRVADLDTMPLYARLSPYAAAMYSFGNGLSIRYFYKETYRAPNFSELYFFTMPRDLRPERARQHNVGITYASTHVGATLDCYYNRVTDKIVAVPTQSMFLWSMQNVGRVHILGVDATAEIDLQPVSVHINYSYQRAVDHTDPDDPTLGKTYGHQIAYTPRHSGGASLRWENRWVNVGTSAMVVGQRYYRMQNSPQNRLPAYCDLSLSADRNFDTRVGTLRLKVQVLNLLDIQYEVVRSYPMMGRQFRLSVIYEI